MTSTQDPSGELSLERLLKLHNLTKEVSGLYRSRLESHLETMAPLFRPRRFLGELVEGSGRERLVGAERNFSELESLYTSVAQRTFDLRPELKSPIESISTRLQLSEWEYTHNVKTDQGQKAIRVTAPLTWVVAYTSSYSLDVMRRVMAGSRAREEDSVRAFVLRACVIHELFGKFPGLSEILSGLRYTFEVRHAPELGKLPLVTISAPFKTLRPPDSLVIMASGLAGGADFTEVLDVESMRAIRDPLKEQVDRFLEGLGEGA
jgi:hypothetical protein